jgi:hypothetical protein
MRHAHAVLWLPQLLLLLLLADVLLLYHLLN